MLKLKQITPMLLTQDFEASLAFYEALGFTAFSRMTQPNYCYLQCEGGALRLLQAGEDMDLDSPHAQHILYFDVEDVDALYAKLKPFLDTLPEKRVLAPFDRFYNQREFHVTEGPHLLMFGQAIPAQ